MEENIVVKDNRIITASYHLSLMEQRVLLSVISKIDSRGVMNADLRYEISISEIATLFEVDKDSIYTQVKGAIDKLYNRSLVLTDNKHDRFRWISRKTYIENEARVLITFTNEIRPFLSELKNNFTKYKIKHTANFKSSYSIRLYELINQFLSKGIIEIPINDIVELWGLKGKYANTTEIRRNTVEKAINEINEYTNLMVACSNKKQGREIVAFVFTFKEKVELSPQEKKRLKVIEEGVQRQFKIKKIQNQKRKNEDFKDIMLDKFYGTEPDKQQEILRDYEKHLKGLGGLVEKSYKKRGLFAQFVIVDFIKWLDDTKDIFE